MNVKELSELGNGLFGKRSTLLSLWQEQADNFYPERADFTFQRSLGTDFAANLMTSYPVLCRRDLGDQISTMLRPTAKEWFHWGLRDPYSDDNDTERFLEWATKVQRRAMYDPVSMFTRATKEGDHDFATFGQCAIRVRLNKAGDALLYTCFHLRDMAWSENEEGKIGLIFRKWKPSARDLMRLFEDKVHFNVRKAATGIGQEPLTEFECMHMVVEADYYSESAKGRPYWSITYDVANDCTLEAVPVWNKEYAIPRWQTVSGSQYAFSPATVAALPDARLIQAMTYTLLEAGEKVVNPPLVATKDVVRSDMAVYAGGVTWVDRDYDEKLGEALRPMTIDAKGMPLGIEMQTRSQQMLAAAFFLNKLTMPQRGPEMTAYEVGQRVEEYIRGALPLFEPMEMNYNGEICELTRDLMMRAGAFGDPRNFPRKVREAMSVGATQFRFESPLHDAIEAQKGQKFMEMKGMIAEAAAFDKNALALPDTIVALRDALHGIKVPAKWINSDTTVKAMKNAEQQAMAATQTIQAAQAGADVAATLATATKDMAAAVPMPA